MKFFKPKDLEYFSLVRGKTFKGGSDLSKEIREKLSLKGAFGKTKHWADLLNKEGFVTEFRNDWQTSGRVRNYSWARIYPSGYEGSLVYFTIGVGSRFTQKDKVVSSIQYKIDCQRNKLAKHQNKAFDAYLEGELGNYPLVSIDIGDLKNYSWPKLKKKTLAYIEKHKDYYEACVNIIWPNGVGNKPDKNDLTTGVYHFKKGHNPTTQGPIKATTSQGERNVYLLHERIKEKIYKQFVKDFKGTGLEVGTENNTGYGKKIDLVVHDPKNSDTFYEIKTGSNALSCIREALGQILEYCYYPNRKNAVKLVIVSPQKLNTNQKAYMKHLRKKLRIQLFYQYYSLKKDKLGTVLH